MDDNLSAGIPTDLETRRLNNKRRRAYARKHWGKRRAVKDAVRFGECGGVPELGHKPHVAVEANIDHIIPKSLGGSDGNQNLRPVCIPIHDRLTEKLNQHRAEGLGSAEWQLWQERVGVKGKMR